MNERRREEKGKGEDGKPAESFWTELYSAM